MHAQCDVGTCLLSALGHLHDEFEERKGDSYKIISFMAKRARGLMVRYAVAHRVTTPEQLKGFDLDGYRFVAAASDTDRLVFRREQKP